MAANMLVLLIVTFICVYPFYYLLIYSVSVPGLASRGVYFLPRGFTLDNIRTVFELNNFWRSIFNSVARTVLGTLLTIIGSSVLGYSFSKTKREIPGRNIMYRLMMYAIYITPGIMPWYITMRMYQLDNNFLLYILPKIVVGGYVIWIKFFFQNMPSALEESAMIDGANYFKIFTRIMLPLSKPILATVAMFSAIDQWNSWYDNFMLNFDPKLMTLQYLLYGYLAESAAQSQALLYNTGLSELAMKVTVPSIRAAVTVIAVTPIFLAYPFLQKHFIRGIAAGAIKE